MVKFFNFFTINLKIIKEGDSFKDKLVLFLYTIFLPLNHLSRLWKKGLSKSLITNTKIRNGDGIFFCDKDIGLVQTASETYEPKLRKYFNIKKGVFIDVGSNIGKYSIMVGNKIKVISIEPSSENFEILKKNLELNNLEETVIPIQAVCSNKIGKERLFLKKKDKGGHSIKENFEKGFEEIESITLDFLIKKYNLKRVDLIKIDVEGAEFEVLQGARQIIKNFSPKIIFECKEKESEKKIRDIMEKRGYKIKKIDKMNYIAEYPLLSCLNK